MSLEDSIERLIQVIEDLTATITVLGEEEPFLELAKSDTGFGDPLRSEVEVADSWPNENIDGTVTSPEPEIISTDDKTIALVNLSKEMGFDYLLEGDQLAVDNRVLDEWNRRKLGDGV